MPISHSSTKQRAWLRLAAPTTGLALALAYGPTDAVYRIGLVLFAVTAGMDLFTRRIPPDAYIYACVTLSIGMAGVLHSPAAALEAFAAQAICYGLSVLAVRYGGFMAGGDIKLIMQFGAVCGSGAFLLTAALLAAAALAVFLLGFALVNVLQHMPVRVVLIRLTELRQPLGPYLWLGTALTGVLSMGLK